MKKQILIPVAVLLLTVNCLLPTFSFTQNIGINVAGTLPDNSAGLDVDFADKGLLIPRVSLTSTTDAATIASPATSLLVYNTNAAMTGGSVGYWYWDGAQWIQFGTGGGGTAWELLGNAGTVDGTNFIGTTDNIPFNIRVNNQRAGRIYSAGMTFLGYQAGNSNTSTGSTGFGYQALYSNTTGYNTAIGYEALRSNTVGVQNTAVGYQALRSNITADFVGNNTATGYQALYTNGTGDNNTATGYWALRSNFSGIANTAMGSLAFRFGNGSYNTAVGCQTYENSTTGSYNTVCGSRALVTNTSGANNTVNGFEAMFFNATGSNNTAYGYQALYNNTVSSLVAIGYQALKSNTAGVQNTAVGYQALYNNTSGPNNTGIGYQTLFSNLTGSENTAIGYAALQNNTTSYNTAVGFGAMSSTTTGPYNTAMGKTALNANGTGERNTAIGMDALNANTSGSYNTGLGMNAGNLNQTGTHNVAVGNEALYWNSASQNTAVGSQALGANTTGSNNTALGYGSGGYFTATANNNVQLGNASVTNLWCADVTITASDARIKNSVQENVPGLAFINQLRPVTYHYDLDKENELLGNKDTSYWQGKYDKEKIQYSGFIAQEVTAAAKKTGYDFNGVVEASQNNPLYGIRYAVFVVPLVKAVQEQQEMIGSQQLSIDNLSRILVDQQSAIGKLQSEKETLKANYDNRIKKLEEALVLSAAVSIQAVVETKK